MSMHNTILEKAEIPNEAVMLHEGGVLKITPYPISLPLSTSGTPMIPTKSAIIKVKVTGICGSDIHLWQHGASSGLQVIEPFSMGHECAGEIVAVGAGLEGFSIGDRVAIKPGAPCLVCDDCTRGQMNLCADMPYGGTFGVDGSCATHKIVPFNQMVKLTDKIDWVAAGLVQPLAIGIQMSRQAGLKAHQTVFIAGGGCVGLLLGAIAKAYGAAKVVVVEKQAHRVEFAKRFCADVAIQNPPRPVNQDSEEYAQDFAFDVLAAVPEASRNRGFDVCIDASGAEECMQMGIELCRPGGTYVQVGMYRGQSPRINMLMVCTKQLNVRGTIRYTAGCFEEAVALIDRGMVDVRSLVDHVYDFRDAQKAFTAVLKGEDENGDKLLKTVILHESKGGPQAKGLVVKARL